MKTYAVVTLCGVVIFYKAISRYEAAEIAREEGWKVVMVSVC